MKSWRSIINECDTDNQRGMQVVRGEAGMLPVDPQFVDFETFTYTSENSPFQPDLARVLLLQALESDREDPNNIKRHRPKQ
jgi:hypothetical protein